MDNPQDFIDDLIEESKCPVCGSANIYGGHPGGLEIEPESAECNECGEVM